ncbi:zinc finger protein basonuclin-2-like isoform X2 [Centruroides vittatus]
MTTENHPIDGAMHRTSLVMDVAIRCTSPNCPCDCFSPGKCQLRICDTCRHGWVVHALDKLGYHHLFNCHQVELVQPTIAFDIASLMLYGTQAIPVRLKILLDRLFSVLKHEEVLQVLHGFGWTYDDYSRGYILHDSNGQVLERWLLATRDEETLILQQFLRFGETKNIAQQLLLQENSEKLDFVVHTASAESDIKRFIQRTNQVVVRQLLRPPSSISSLSPSSSPLSPLNKLQNMQPYEYRQTSSPCTSNSVSTSTTIVTSTTTVTSDVSVTDCGSEDDSNAMAINLTQASCNSVFAVKKVKHLRKSANPMKRRWNPLVLSTLITNPSTGKKRVQCHVCLKTFCDKGALKIHFSAVHLREMHKCTVEGCNMMFSSRRSRNRHSANPNPKLHTPNVRRRISPHDGRTSTPYPMSLVPYPSQLVPLPLTKKARLDENLEPNPPPSLKGVSKRKCFNPTKCAVTSDDDLQYISSEDTSSDTYIDKSEDLTTEDDDSLDKEDKVTDFSTKIIKTEITNPCDADDIKEEPKIEKNDDALENPLRHLESLSLGTFPGLSNDNQTNTSGVSFHAPGLGLASSSPVSMLNSHPLTNGDAEQDPQLSLLPIYRNPNLTSAVDVPVDKENPRRCTACGKIFQNHFGVKTHYQNVHLKLMHKCTVEGCNASFPSKRSRDRHSANLNLHRKLLSTSSDKSIHYFDKYPFPHPGPTVREDLFSRLYDPQNLALTFPDFYQNRGTDSLMTSFPNPLVSPFHPAFLAAGVLANNTNRTNSPNTPSPTPSRSPSNIYRCELCSENFNDCVSLREHCDKSHNEKSFLNSTFHELPRKETASAAS